MPLSVEMDDHSRAEFQKTLRQYAVVLGKDISTAPRRAAIQLCKSLRAGTRSSLKYARTGEYTIEKSSADPLHKWITSKRGEKLRRWTLTRTVRGGIRYDVYAATKKDVRLRRLRLFHRGLAKQSWGWVMHNIFSGAAPDAPWKRRRRDRRDPTACAKDSYSKEGKNGGVAVIANRLGYIREALKIPVSAAVAKARGWMMHQIKARASKFSAARASL